jgi:hypothetical protein
MDTLKILAHFMGSIPVNAVVIKVLIAITLVIVTARQSLSMLKEMALI